MGDKRKDKNEKRLKRKKDHPLQGGLMPGIRDLIILDVASVFPYSQGGLAISPPTLHRPYAHKLIVGELARQEG